MELKRFKIYSAVSILACVVVLGIASNLSAPPNLLHQWRQCDGLSMSLNYFEEGMEFFSPKIHFQHSEDGRAVGEFPILYYVNALVWKVTGHSYLAARLLNLLIFLAGLYYLSLASLKVTRNEVVSLCAPLIVLSSPLIARYAPSFLPNTTALSFVFISVYFFVKHYESERLRYLVICVVFASMAALMRTTMLIGYMPFLVIAVHKRFDWKRLVLMVLPLVAVLAWVLFIKSYNEDSGSVYFLTKITPLWKMSSGEIDGVWDLINGNIKYLLMNLVLFWGLIAGVGISVWKMNEVGSKLMLYVSLVYLATVAYFVLWFKKIGVHDYYYVELFILVPSVVVLFGGTELSKTKWAKIAVVVVSALSVSLCAVKNRYIKSPSKKLNVVERVVLKGEEVGFWTWFHDNYNAKFRAFETVKPFMRELGVERDDLVFSIQDPSPNVTLYLMDVKGYTALYQHGKTYDEQVKWMIDRGVEYLVTADKSIVEEISAELVGEHLGSWENIDIWRIH